MKKTKYIVLIILAILVGLMTITGIVLTLILIGNQGTKLAIAIPCCFVLSVLVGFVQWNLDKLETAKLTQKCYRLLDRIFEGK